jgi:uncharacterized protein
MLDMKELIELTLHYGGEYGLNHTKRILKIIDFIGEKYSYNREVVDIAAYLHDWGGYAPWKKENVDHAIRSAEAAREYLGERFINEDHIKHILECIENHHNGRKNKSIEARLLSDADGIDFIGTIGFAREFSTKPRELKKAFESAKARIDKVKAVICIEESEPIVKERIERMTLLFKQFEEETWGLF